MSGLDWTRGHETFLAMYAEELPPVRLDVASLSTAELERRCNDYFAQLDQPQPPECLMADYEAACEELMHRRNAPAEMVGSLLTAAAPPTG